MFADFNWIEAMRTSPIMMILMGCSLITVAVALERAMYFRQRSGNADKALAQALEAFGRGDRKQAQWLSSSCSHPLGAAAAAIFDGVRRKRENVEEALQIALSGQKLLLERNLGVLGSMAAIAPLVGLLGTVWGIMRAFHDMGQTGSAAPSVVAAGVAEALLTTAAGLVVAVPAVLLYNHFTRRMSVMLTVAENHARSLRVTMEEDENPDDGSAVERQSIGKLESAIHRTGEKAVPSPTV